VRGTTPGDDAGEPGEERLASTTHASFEWLYPVGHVVLHTLDSGSYVYVAFATGVVPEHMRETSCVGMSNHVGSMSR
jgi:hypothetical protein